MGACHFANEAAHIVTYEESPTISHCLIVIYNCRYAAGQKQTAVTVYYESMLFAEM